MPKNRSLDIISITWDNGICVRDAEYQEVDAGHFWDERVETRDGISTTVRTKRYVKKISYKASRYNLENNQYFVRNEYIMAAIDLQDDYFGYDTKRMLSIDTNILNEGIYVSFYIKPVTASKRLELYIDYLHTKISYDVLSVTLTGIGGVSGAISAIYEVASGSNKTVKTEISGIDHRFTFTYK